MKAIGIDVGGVKKGFHLALADSTSQNIESICANASIQEAIEFVDNHQPEIIAIDCPPRAAINGPNTRLSERQINRLPGVRIQWTRRPSHTPPEWMTHGEQLWRALAHEFPQLPIIETFPTAVAISMNNCPIHFPLTLCKGNTKLRSGYKDLLDASLCAYVGLKVLQATANVVGTDDLTGETDELGPIYY